MWPVMRCQNPVKRWEISKAIPFFFSILIADRKATNSGGRIPERYPMIPKTRKAEKAKGNLKCWMVSRVNRGFDSHSHEGLVQMEVSAILTSPPCQFWGSGLCDSSALTFCSFCSQKSEVVFLGSIIQSPKSWTYPEPNHNLRWFSQVSKF